MQEHEFFKNPMKNIDELNNLLKKIDEIDLQKFFIMKKKFDTKEKNYLKELNKKISLKIR